MCGPFSAFVAFADIFGIVLGRGHGVAFDLAPASGALHHMAMGFALTGVPADELPGFNLPVMELKTKGAKFLFPTSRDLF